MAIKINGKESKKEPVDSPKPLVELEIKNLVQKETKKVIKKVTQERKDDGKFSMSYSRLRNYIKCPKSFEYHTKYGWEASDGTKKLLREGLIFEAAVLGDKNGILGALSKKDKDIVERAENFKKNNLLGDGEGFVKIKFENEIFRMRGEIDFLGEYEFDNGKRRGIVDLKWTGKIDWTWSTFNYKEDVLQVLIYSWMHWKQTGEMLDAVYLVVDASYEDPVYAAKEVFITMEDYKWLEKFLYRVALEPYKVANPSKRNCLGGKGEGRCPFLKYCKVGRDILGGKETYNLGSLPSKLDNNINY